jgi:D-alanyl-D-alanine carboxypeptidase
MPRKVFGLLVLILLIALLGALVVGRRLVPERPAPTPTPDVLEESLPTSSPAPSPTPTHMPEPYADRPDIEIGDWQYTLVNGENLLAADYAPELAAVGDGQFFDARAADALKDFIAGARAEGLQVYITSSYRAYNTQKYLFDKKVGEYLYSAGSQDAAVEKAKTIVAYPGTSEHQLGLACDLVDQYYDYMNESLADTVLSQWMAAHCAEYGFILRYPRDKTEITGVMFEPWHFRYVGKEAAAYIMEKGLALEEFVALYK